MSSRGDTNPVSGPFASAQFNCGEKMNIKSAMLYDANKRHIGFSIFLWLLFGSLGAHRFYLGDTKYGVAMLFVSCICIGLYAANASFYQIFMYAIGVWVLIDGLSIPYMVQKQNNELIKKIELETTN